MIRLSHLQKYFNRGKQNEIHVINDISLELPERGMVAIFGRSGCGKTTLLNVLGGLDSFANGTLTVDGADMTTDADELRNRCIGYIFQNYNLQKEETNFENVAVALRLCGMTDEAEIERRVMAALTAVDMARYRYRTPDTLSGGQQQRIAIARAIVKNPAVILADEPTGNLDEANTLLIMDLLHALAREHLVVLVTHEANLVDHYCDRVIELSDGRVVGERTNENANGMVARGKNDIYLGELEKDAGETAGVAIEYYGEKPETPIRLRLVKREGVTYLKVETPGVHILDSGSEVRLREGVFSEARTAETDGAVAGMDLSALPPIHGQHYGRLFRFWYSVKSGYRALCVNRKKGKKLLLTCMALFSMVAVIMTAVLGTGIRDLLSVNDSCSDHLIYVRTADESVANKLTDALKDDTSGIRTVQYISYLSGNSNVTLTLDFFETYQATEYEESCCYLDGRLSADLPRLAGTVSSPARGEVVLSKKLADAFLADMSEDYIRDYSGFLNLKLSALYASTFRIVGVVDSDELAVYFNELDVASYAASQRSLSVGLASDWGITLKAGEAAVRQSFAESVKVCGKSFTVTQVLKNYSAGDYASWLAEQTNDKTVYDFDAWVTQNGLDYDEAYQTQCFVWLEQYFARAQEFYQYLRTTEPESIEVWAGADGDMTSVLLTESTVLVSPEIYYYAYLQKQATGSFPTMEEAYSQADIEQLYNDYAINISKAEIAYYDWYYNDGGYALVRTGEAQILLSDADFLDVVTRWGSSTIDNEYSQRPYNYIAVYTDDVTRTLAWLDATLGAIEEYEDLPGIVTPNGMRTLRLAESRAEIVFCLIALAVLLGVLCLCMYFIMRSALMSRVREVGIWRAIGVSKKNLLYRFFVESLVTATLTVAVGFFIVSGIMYAMSISNSLMATLVYYPIWLAGLLLAVLYAVCILCGTAPVLSLLSRSPSAILAKYDI